MSGAMQRRSSRLMGLPRFSTRPLGGPSPSPKKTGPFPNPPPACLSAPRRYSRAWLILHYSSGPRRARKPSSPAFSRLQPCASAGRAYIRHCDQPRHVHSIPEAGGGRQSKALDVEEAAVTRRSKDIDDGIDGLRNSWDWPTATTRLYVLCRPTSTCRKNC
jgi:hypothetical protein